MRFLTARKRAEGLGSAKEGTHHFWSMQVSSVALLILVPLFIFIVGPALGKPYPEVVLLFSRPFPAIVTGLTLLVGMAHFKNGAQVMVEDYVHGPALKWTLIGVTCLAYAIAATGIFAIARLAL